MSLLTRMVEELVEQLPGRSFSRAVWHNLMGARQSAVRQVGREIEQLEARDVPTLLGQQLFPLDNPWNQNIANAPVASNSAAVIANIGASVKVHPDIGYDNPANTNDPLYGIPFNVVHGNSVAKINVNIIGYPSQSDIEPVPIPSNVVIEGDYQSGPNLSGAGYGNGQRGDSHMIIWDEDNNIAYELFGTERPDDSNNTSGEWQALQETVWNMNTDTFRQLGETSADAAGLSILAGLMRPDEALPVSQGGQGAIDHAIRFTLPESDINPQYIYPASHEINTSQSSDNLPLGARLRLENNSTVDSLIAKMGPEAQAVATAMQQYGLILADAGSTMFISGSSASVDANNNIDLTWDMNDILGLESLTTSDFQVVNLTPIVSGLSASSAAPNSTITITGQNFSGAAGNLSVYFGTTASPSVTVVSDTEVTAVVPSGTGAVNITVESGITGETDNWSSNPNANVTAPIFGYGVSATSSADQFTFSSDQTVSPNSTVSFADPTVTSGGTDLVTFVVVDTNGKPIASLPNSAFSLSLSGGTSTGTFGAVSQTSTPGTYTCTFTGATNGSASELTATIEGVQLSVQPQVTVNPVTISPSNSSASFTTSSVNSGWTDYVNITVKDTNGKPVAGLPGSDFTLNLAGGASTGNFGPVTQTATAGTYTSTFTGIKAGTASELVVVVNGVQLTAEPTVTVTPGSVSAANSSVSFANSSVASGSTDQASFVIEDSNGNPITGLTSSSFSLSLSGGASTGSLSAVAQSSTPGTYTSTFTGVKAGSASQLIAIVSSVELSSQPQITVTPGTISAAKSIASFASSTLTSNGTDLVTLVIEDANGNAVAGLAGTAFSLSLSGGTSTGTFSAVTQTSTPGTYTSTFTGVTAGTASQLVVTVSGVQLASEPKVTVSPGAISASNSTATFANSAVTAGSTDLVTFVVEDSNGNPIAGLATSAFSLKLSGGTSTGALGAVSQTSTPGTYTCYFTGALNGSASTLTATIEGVQLLSAPQVTVNPGTVSATNSSASFANPTVISGSSDNVTITVKDSNGNAIAGLPSSAFAMSLSSGTSTGTFGTVAQTASPGVYTATFTGVAAGSASDLAVTVDSIQLASEPGVTVTAGAISAGNSTASFANSTATSGATDLVTLVLKDANGNPITGLTNSSFSLSLSNGTSTGSFGTVATTSTPGTYTSTFTAVKAGTASALAVTVSSIQLVAQPQVTVNAGAVSAANSSASFSSPTVTSGAGDVLTLVLEDANGNPIAGLSGTAFSLGISGGASTGIFSTVSPASTPGTYTSTFTGIKAGSASALSSTVNSIALTGRPQVSVVPGAVDPSLSSVSIVNPSVTSGNTDAINFTIEDENGNPITGLTNSAFSMSLSGGTSTGTLGTVSPTSTPGAYTSAFTGKGAGTPSEMTWTVNATQLANQPQVTVNPGAVNAGKTLVSFASPTVVSGGADVITFVVEDANGNPIAGLPASSFSLILSGGASSGTFGTVAQTSTPGTYTSTFTGVLAGTASELKAVISGVQISAQAAVSVTPGAVDPANSSASFATSTVLAGNTDLVTIKLKDANGNAVTGLSNSDFALSLSSGQSTGSFGAVNATSTAGTYTAEFTGGLIGTASKLQVSVDGVALASTSSVTIKLGSVSGVTSEVTINNSTLASGTTGAITIEVKDAGGNPISGLAASAFVFHLTGGTTTGTFSAVKASSPGVYTATFTGVHAGTGSSLSLSVNNAAFVNKPTVQVTPGALSVSKSIVSVAAKTLASGSSETVTITLEDAAGNVITSVPTSALSFAFAGGKSTGTFGTVTQLASGVYTVPLTGVLAGAASKVAVSVNGVSLTSEPSVTVEHGSINGTQSKVVLPTPTVEAGKTETITITVTDAAGNPISGLASSSKNFVFALTGSTSSGTFSGLKASTTPGVYTVVFKGVKAGTPGTLSVVVEGVELATQPQLQVT